MRLKVDRNRKKNDLRGKRQRMKADSHKSNKHLCDKTYVDKSGFVNCLMVMLQPKQLPIAILIFFTKRIALYCVATNTGVGNDDDDHYHSDHRSCTG